MRLMKLTALAILVAGFTSCKKVIDAIKPDKPTKPSVQTLVLRPDGNGHDVLVAYTIKNDKYETYTHLHNPEIVATTWDFTEGWGAARGFIKFEGLNSLPENTNIISAKLSLYGVASGFTTHQGNWGDNNAWLSRVTETWDVNTINWINKPAFTETNQVFVQGPGTTQRFNYNVENIDVTRLVRIMVAEGFNQGFCLRTQNETLYTQRSLSFANSRHSDSTRHPKLVVEYELK